MMLPIAVFYFTIVSAAIFKIDLGAGNFLKTVCSPAHPTSLNGHSDYICTLKERDFYPESIATAVQGLEIMAQADMVKDLQIVLARNLLKLKREKAEEFKVYKSELGGEEEFESLVWNLIQGGWATESFDYGFELFEEFDLDSRVLINKATPHKLIERLAKRKPKLAVKLFHLLTPHEKISAVLNDQSGSVFNEFLENIKARSSNLDSVFSEIIPHLCQQKAKGIQKFNLIVEQFEEKEAAILSSIHEICYGNDENKAIELFKENKNEQFVLEAALMSNNYKTTLEVLKLENKAEILNVLNLFQDEQMKTVLSLLKESNYIEFNESDDLLKIIIENGLESAEPASGSIITKAINSLQKQVQVNLHLKGLGKIFINSNVKNAVSENYEKIKFKFSALTLATLIKDDNLFTFVHEFGNEKFTKTFDFDRFDVLLTYLNRAEDFDAAYKLFKLKNGDITWESDFLVDNLNSALKMFPHDDQSEEGASQIFLMMRRAQIEHLISKFKAEFFPKLPETFVETLKKTQEL